MNKNKNINKKKILKLVDDSQSPACRRYVNFENNIQF